MENKPKTIYCGSGKKQSDTWFKVTINPDKIQDYINEFNGSKYVKLNINIKNEPDQFGNQGPVIVDQTKEEREAKVAKTYLGNCKVVWTDGVFPEPNRDNQQPQKQAQPQAVAADPDLPF